MLVAVCKVAAAPTVAAPASSTLPAIERIWSTRLDSACSGVCLGGAGFVVARFLAGALRFGVAGLAMACPLPGLGLPDYFPWILWRDSWRSCASIENEVVGRASRRRSPIGSPVSSQ
jgi:hypothetical protein